MKKPRILVVGSFVMDQIMTTSVFPKEGQTVIGKAFSKALGGKGANQAVQMARLGASVTMVGKLGDDANGREMFEACKNAGLDMSHVAIATDTPTACATIILEEKAGGIENRIIVYPGANMALCEEDVAFLKSDIAKYDLVVLQLEIPMEINLLVAKHAHWAGVPVFLNTAPYAPLPKELLEYLTYICPNETEAEGLTGIAIPREGRSADLAVAKQAASILLARGAKNVLITLGAAGAVLYSSVGALYSPAVNGIKALDPTAAGDSFIGGFCYAITCGMDMESALQFANHAAAITVSHMGAIPSLPTLEQVKELLGEL